VPLSTMLSAGSVRLRKISHQRFSIWKLVSRQVPWSTGRAPNARRFSQFYVSGD
jgi:hypothetical protein